MNARNDPPVITGDDVECMLDALRNQACYPHPVQYSNMLETHTPWVIRTGACACKIKKPVNIGLLDFTSLAPANTAQQAHRINARFRHCDGLAQRLQM